jgi:predicted MFS family arabinose efflux permease
MGAAAAFGPLVGGYLTTYHSWRWSFRINVIVAPVVMIGMLLFMRRDERVRNRPPLDIPGALLVAAGMFTLVFGITESSLYGWWKPLRPFTVVGHTVWSDTHGVSVVPLAFVIAVVCLVSFVRLELAKERRGGHPLFEFSQLQNRFFRYGIAVAFLLSMGQFGMMFVVPVFLQDVKHLSALDNGLWTCPMGIAMLIAAQVGGQLTRRVGTVTLVRAGLIIDAVGLGAEAFLLRRGVTFWQLAPVLFFYGFGSGFVSSQLTNVVLTGVSPQHAGAASGANSTSRQTGAALGIAVVGTVFAILTARHGLVSAARPAMLTGAAILCVAAGVAWLIPKGETQHAFAAAEEGVDLYDLVEPVDAHLKG